MNMKWMGLVAVMVVFSSGCSDSEQDSANKATSDTEASTGVEVESVEIEEVKGVIKPNKTPEQKEAIKELLSSSEGIPPEKLDSEVKKLVEKIGQNSEMTEEEAAKLEQDLKGVFQKIEAERVTQ